MPGPNFPDLPRSGERERERERERVEHDDPRWSWDVKMSDRGGISRSLCPISRDNLHPAEAETAAFLRTQPKSDLANVKVLA